MAGIINVSQEIEKLTRQYLLDSLSPGFYASDFSQEHFDTFLDELIPQFGEKETLGRMKVINTALYEHFKDFGQETEIKILDRKIKVVKKFNDGITSVDVDKAYTKLDILTGRLLKDEKKYALMDNLWCFSDDALEPLYDNFADTSISANSETIRPLIRASVRHRFELGNKDIILFMRKKLYVRTFVDIRVLKGENQRFLGASAEELEDVYKEHFPEDFKQILLELAPDVFDDGLDFSLIDSMTFRSKYINVFRTLVDLAMSSYVGKLEEKTVMALNGFVLRIHFDALIRLCATTLVDMVMMRDKNADTFLRFYNGETILDAAGNKIKKPFIIDANDNTWNYNSIFSIMKQYEQYLSKHEKQTQLLKESEKFHKHAAAEVVSARFKKKELIEEARQTRAQHTSSVMSVKKLENIEKPTKDQLSILRHERSRENELQKKYNHSFEQEASMSAKLKNCMIAEQNRLKQFRTSTQALDNLEKRGAELQLQQKHILAAIGKALIFR